MTRRYSLIIACIFAINASAQSDFNTHIGAHLSNQGMSSVGYPFSSQYGLYGHFLPEILVQDLNITLEVSPNPFKHSFKVTCNNQEILSIELQDALGRTIYTSERKDLYQPNVPAGKYYLVATTSLGQAIKTIIRIE